MPSTTPPVPPELRVLVEDYALAADAGDADRFLALFAPDAVVEVDDGTRVGRMVGHDQLAEIPRRLARYLQTRHLLGQSRSVFEAGEWTGVVYCEAHHLVGDDDGQVTDRVMHIRYLDHYTDTDLGYRFARRRVEIDWITTHRVDQARRGS